MFQMNLWVLVRGHPHGVVVGDLCVEGVGRVDLLAPVGGRLLVEDGEEGGAVECGGIVRHARIVENGGRDVRPGDESVAGGAAIAVAGAADEAGEPHAGIVERRLGDREGGARCRRCRGRACPPACRRRRRICMSRPTPRSKRETDWQYWAHCGAGPRGCRAGRRGRECPRRRRAARGRRGSPRPGLPNRFRAAGMGVENPPVAVRIVGAPVEEEGLVPLDEGAAVLAHAHIVAPDAGEHLVEGEDVHRAHGGTCPARPGAVAGLLQHRGQADDTVEAGEVVAAVDVAVGAVRVVLQAGQDHGAAGPRSSRSCRRRW